MQWSQVSQKLAELYTGVSTWVFEHPVETDVLIISAVLFGIYKYARRDVRMKRRHIRFIRGSWMSKDERYQRQLMRFEDALGDAALDMLISGEMNKEDEQHWLRIFADGNVYNMKGLMPYKTRESRIKGALARIKYYQKTPWSGNKSGGVLSVIPDRTYNPNPDTGLALSKYAKKE